METHRIDREDSTVLEGHGIEGLGHSQEEGDVARHVAGPEDLEDDLAPPEIAGKLDRAAADDVDPAGSLPSPEQRCARGMILLVDESGEFGDVPQPEGGHLDRVVDPERAQIPTQPLGDPERVLNRRLVHSEETRSVAEIIPVREKNGEAVCLGETRPSVGDAIKSEGLHSRRVLEESLLEHISWPKKVAVVTLEM